MGWTELEPAQYPIIRPLYEPLEYNLVVGSVIAGNTPAWVFTDDEINPQAALVWDLQDALLVAGSPYDSAVQTGIRNLLLQRVLPDAMARRIPEMALAFTRPEWNPAVATLLPGLKPRPAQRCAYRFEGPLPAWRGRIPVGLAIHRIDDGLLDSQLVRLGEVRRWIDSFWRTPAGFLHDGFGYCALDGDTIAAWCLTVFVAGSRRELGLETAPEYRDRGLATLVASACVEHALAEDAIPELHCDTSNPASARVAEKIGFQKEREYQVYRFTVE